MTNNKRTIAILSITSILIFSGFGYSPFAYSTGSWSGGDKDWDDFKDFKKWKGGGNDSEPEIESGLCEDDEANLIKNGCFEDPVVGTDEGWNIYDSAAVPFWEVAWLDPENACEGFPEDYPAQLELQRGILQGPAQQAQHAELDTDCNGPDADSLGEELTSVSISQNTKIVTSEDDEYTITFAYKARPGKNTPLSTNGLAVSWNGEDITPDLKFSKKKWKYASITVSGPEISGPSELKFEDTGNPDTLGTFLDDVSVYKVPKPVVTVILTKEINNEADPNNSLVTNDLDDFDITLHVDDVPVPETQIGEDNPNIFPNVPTEGGSDFKITEDATYYVATVTGDGCPEVNNDESSVNLEPGDTLTCHILNTFVPPPVMTLKKALTNDNGGSAKASDFTVKIWDENGPDPDEDPQTNDGVLKKTVHFDKDTSQVEISDLIPGKYVITEEIIPAGDDGDPNTPGDNPEASALGDYTTVLIAGDTLCPSMENEVFELSIGNNITCTIYNDDNFNADSSGDAGRIFHTNSIEFMYNAQLDNVPDEDDPDDMRPAYGITNLQGMNFDCSVGETCISLDPGDDGILGDGMNSESDDDRPNVFIIQDPLINKPTSIVVFNVFPLGPDDNIANNELAETDRCVVKTLLPGPEVDTLSFSWECELIEGQFEILNNGETFTSSGKYRINYAVIDALA